MPAFLALDFMSHVSLLTNSDICVSHFYSLSLIQKNVHYCAHLRSAGSNSSLMFPCYVKILYCKKKGYQYFDSSVLLKRRSNQSTTIRQ